MLKHSAADFEGFASAADPNATLLEPFGTPGVLVVVWSSRVPFEAPGGHLEVQVGIWSSRWPLFGAPGCHLQVQVTMWRSRVSFGAAGGRLEVQVAVWSSKWPRGAPNGSLELQCGLGGLPGCGGLWQPSRVPIRNLYSKNLRI